MEGMLMLLVMMVIAVVLAWVLDGEQRKRAVSLLLCAAMMSSYIPAINVAKADSTAKPVLVNEQVLVNGVKTAQIGAVTYSASESAYTIDTSSAKVRVKNGDSISFEGAISAPEGETISWVRVDVYDANTEEPYTVGAEYYRADGLKVQQYDLSNIPTLTIGEAFGSKDYALAEGGKYIVMFCVGDSNGNAFADMDADIEEDQGPAILVDVKLSPSNCKHPHSDYVYILHSSGEVRKQSYGDSMTHQVEPLYERYCGLCDTFLMNIWGEGTPEEHSMDSNGVCLGCGYSSISLAEEVDSPYSTAIMMEEFTVTPPILMLGESAEVAGAISGYGSMLKDVKVYVYKKGDHTQGGVSGINESNVDTYYYELNGNQIVSDATYGNLHMGVGTYDVVLFITDENGKGFEDSPTVTIEVVEKEENAIFINSHQELNTVEVGDLITVTWTNANSYSYVVDTVRLDGEPAYTPETESGYSFGLFETQGNYVTFAVDNNDAGKYIKVTIWGIDENGGLLQEPDYAYFYVKGSEIEGPSIEGFSVSPEEISEGESFAVYGTVNGNGDYLKTVRVSIWNAEDETLGGYLAEYDDLNQLSFELGFAYSTGIDIGNITLGEGDYIVEVTAEDENGNGFEQRQIQNITIGPRKADSAILIQSHNDGDEIDENEEVEITWESGKSERYVVNAIVLDDVPAYSEDESGTVLQQDLITSDNSYTFVAPWVNSTIETERWVKISIYGISGENDNVTEMQTTVYLKILPILDYFSYRIDEEGNAIIGSYNGTESDVSIPAEIDGRVVTGIDSSAFNGTEIKNLHLPSTINWIGKGAFASSSLNSVNIPEGVSEIPDSAFHGCSELTSVSLPSSITSIGEYAFYLCSALTDIDLPSNVNSIGAYAFDGCRNANGLSLPQNLEELGKHAFAASGIAQLDIPEGLNSIPDYAFQSCWNLSSVTIPESISSIDESAFEGSGLTSIVIPATVTNIGANAFVQKGLSSSATIYGYYNSAAQEHAEEYYITFVALDNVEKGLFLDNFSLSSESVTEGESISINGNVVGNGVTITSIAVAIRNAENEDLGGYIVHETGLNLGSVDLGSYGEFETGTAVGNTVIGPGRYIVEIYATDENGNGLLNEQQRSLTVTEYESNATVNISVDRNYAKIWDIVSVSGTAKSGDYYLKKVQVSVFTDNSGVHGYLSDTAVKEFDYEDQVKEFDLSDLGAFAIKKTFICEAHGVEEAFPSGNALITVYVSVYGPDGDEEANEFGTSASEELLVVENSIYPWIKEVGIARDTIGIDDPIQLSGQICDDFGLAELYVWVEPVGEGMNLSWSQPIEGKVYDLGNVILSPGIDVGWWSPGLYTVSIDAMNTNGRCFESGRVTIVGLLTIGEEAKEITLSADKTEINAGESVTFTAQSDADSVTLYIEAYNEVAGEWYVAVTKEMAKNGSEFTYTHEFANAGSKRVYAKTVNGTTSNMIEITANALKETLEAPVGGTMTTTVDEEVTISWGAVANATGYTAHLYEMVDGQLESIGDVTSLINGTSLKYTFTETGEYHVGVIATAEGYNPSEQSAVIVTVEKKQCDHSNIIWKEETVCEPLPENTAEYHTHHAVVVTKRAYCNDCDVTEPLDDLYPPQEVSRNKDLHQLTDGDCLVCGYEATFVPECEHLNKVIDESSIVVENRTENEHTISYWYFCNGCQTLLNNVAREESTAAHTFDANEVCTVCGYTKNPQNLPTMTFEVDKTTVNAGEEIEFTFTMTGGSPMANKVMLYAEDKHILTVGAGEEYNFDFAPAQGVFTWKYKFNQSGLRKIHFVPLYEDATTRVEGIKTAVQEIQVNAYLNLLVDGVLQDITTRKMALTVYDNGGSGTPITVDSNVAWTVKTDASWIKPTADTANKQILHEYEVNNTSAARVGTITVSAPGCEDWVITCTQEAVPLTWSIWQENSYVHVDVATGAMNPEHKYILHVYKAGGYTSLKEVEFEEALEQFHYYDKLGMVRGTKYELSVEVQDAQGNTLRNTGRVEFSLGYYASISNVKIGGVTANSTNELVGEGDITFTWDGSLGLDAYVYAVINGKTINIANEKVGKSVSTATISASRFKDLLTSEKTPIKICVEVGSYKVEWPKSGMGYIVKRPEVQPTYVVKYKVDEAGADFVVATNNQINLTLTPNTQQTLMVGISAQINGETKWLQGGKEGYKYVSLNPDVLKFDGASAEVKNAGTANVDFVDPNGKKLAAFSVVIVVVDNTTHDVTVSFQYEDTFKITEVSATIKNKANQLIADAQFMAGAADAVFDMVGDVLNELSGGDAKKLAELQYEFLMLYSSELGKVAARQFGIDVNVNIPYFGNVRTGGKTQIEGAIAAAEDLSKTWDELWAVKGPSKEVFTRSDGQGFVVDIGNTGSVKIVEVVIDGEKVNFRSSSSPYSFRVVGSPYILSVGAHDQKIVVGDQAGVVALELLKNGQPIAQFTVTTANFSDASANADEMSQILHYIGTSAPQYVFACCQLSAVEYAYWCMLTKNNTEDNLLADEFGKAGFWQDENGIYHTGTKYCANCHEFWRGGNKCQACGATEYYADTDCWQMYCGYTDLYDEVFNIATDMDRLKLPFTVGDTEYIIWAWKGDYLNLGAGAELGIYEKTPDNNSSFYEINKAISMPMTLQLYYDGELIIDYDPGINNPQWWITGFNPDSDYYDCDVNKLTAVYTIQFVDRELFDAFYAQWRIAPYLGVQCDTEKMLVTITF